MQLISRTVRERRLKPETSLFNQRGGEASFANQKTKLSRRAHNPQTGCSNQPLAKFYYGLTLMFLTPAPFGIMITFVIFVSVILITDFTFV